VVIAGFLFGMSARYASFRGDNPAMRLCSAVLKNSPIKPSDLGVLFGGQALMTILISSSEIGCVSVFGRLPGGERDS
jgi:hypothetical protein